MECGACGAPKPGMDAAALAALEKKQAEDKAKAVAAFGGGSLPGFENAMTISLK